VTKCITKTQLPLRGQRLFLTDFPVSPLRFQTITLFDYDKDTLSDVVMELILADFEAISFEVF
jgi:hypothetical protein